MVLRPMRNPSTILWSTVNLRLSSQASTKIPIIQHLRARARFQADHKRAGAHVPYAGSLLQKLESHLKRDRIIGRRPNSGRTAREDLKVEVRLMQVDESKICVEFNRQAGDAWYFYEQVQKMKEKLSDIDDATFD